MSSAPSPAPASSLDTLARIRTGPVPHIAAQFASDSRDRGERTRLLVREFYWMVRVFVLGLGSYIGRVTDAIRLEAPGTPTGRQLEMILATAAPILADECFAKGGHSATHIHYYLFARLFAKAGIATAEGAPSYPPRASTDSAIRQIETLFRDAPLLEGVGLIAATEVLALPMLRSIRSRLTQFSETRLPDPYTAEELEHLDLHLALEIEHGQEATELVHSLGLTGAHHTMVTNGIVRAEAAWITFWNGI